MQNMKLLEDLETGKYLELGKDFLYGGVGILVSKIKLDFPLPMYLFNAVKSDYDWLNNAQTQPVNISDIATFETIRDLIPEPLKTPCEKTGAVVYGGRYVLMNEIDVWVYNNDLQPKKIKTGDVIKEQTSYLDRKYTVINVSDFFLDTTEGIKTTHKLGKKTFSKYDFFAIEKNFGNIFEEYSKQLRNEPNKFDELIELLK